MQNDPELIEVIVKPARAWEAEEGHGKNNPSAEDPFDYQFKQYLRWCDRVRAECISKRWAGELKKDGNGKYRNPKVIDYLARLGYQIHFIMLTYDFDNPPAEPHLQLVGIFAWKPSFDRMIFDKANPDNCIRNDNPLPV